MNHKQFVHYIAFLFSMLAAVCCTILVFHVNVNSDMTKYLPDDSPMKQGLDIMASEFNAAQLQTADVRVMIRDVSDEREELAEQLLSYDNVRDVTYVVSQDSAYTLYNLVVPKSVDQKALGAAICNHYGEDAIVETSQDGATPPIIVIIIAAVLILLILFIMAQSWIDPMVVMTSAGIAVIINVGTNAFFPSVSITTNYIVAILQLVLSLDYSIILMNRYRQEWKQSDKYLAMNKAMKRAFRPILSSALTTIVGLMMLLLMRLKIGTDMGLVLAKGVLCSLICTFTVMPSLLLWCTTIMKKWAKSAFVLPTDRLSRYATHHKVILSIFSLVLFIFAYYFSRKTDISFSTNGESRIAKVFPAANPILVIYDVQDEMNIITMADTLSQHTSVNKVISYPTLLKQQYTADELTSYIHESMATMEEYLPPVEGLDMLTPELMRMVYYQHSGASDTLRVPFTQIMNCIRYDLLSNPFFAQMIDPQTREKMQLLNLIMDAMNEPDEPEELELTKAKPVHTALHTEPIRPIVPSLSGRDSTQVVKRKEQVVERQTKEIEEEVAVTQIPLITFLAKLDETDQTDLTQELRRLTDVKRLQKEMNVRQMADFIGSTISQTKMVYSFADEGKKMTPIEYVHFLTDDLFKRRALANLVSEEQKQQLNNRKNLMDMALNEPVCSPAEIIEILQPFPLQLTPERVQQLAGTRKVIRFVDHDVVREIEVVTMDTFFHADMTQNEPTQRPARSSVRTKSKEEQQAELMLKLLRSDKPLSSVELAKQFKRLGESVDVATVKMLYGFYGSLYSYDSTLTMNVEQVLTYVMDTLILDPEVSRLLGDTMTSQLQNIHAMIDQNITMMSNDRHGLLVLVTDLPDESEQTYRFMDTLQTIAANNLSHPYYLIGESVMYSEMKDGFGDEMKRITWLTILAIFLIVALSFRSLIVPSILVMTVMTAVFVNVIFSGLISGQMLYLAYLIVQSILMGATIDYGILYTNYYKEYRKTMDQYQAAQEAYHGSIRTIMTSGLIMVLGPGVMALLIDDVAISAIVGSLAVGAIVAIVLILAVLPGVLIAFDRWVVGKR